jgi:hypothetical protein
MIMENNYQRKKLLYGSIYGLVCGLAFVIFAWGIDAVLLYRANSTFSFLKLVAGLVICVPASTLAGRLTVAESNHWVAFLVWAALAALFAWLVLWLPTDGTREIGGELNHSLSPFLQQGEIANLWQYRLFVTLIIALASILSGLLEINLVEGALLNSYPASIISMVAVSVVLFGIAGAACDYMINTNFREPVVVLHDLLVFAREHQGEEVPTNIARKMHLSSVRQIGDILNTPHRLTLMKYDPHLGQMEVLVNFDDVLVQCTTIYGQPTNCIRLLSEP